MISEQQIETNRKHWNTVFKNFAGWCALPAWGVFEIGKDDPTLLGEVRGKTFLEVCCGSGHSIKYLIANGAKKVYAIDLSDEQLKLAKKNNEEAVEQGAVSLIQTNMEKLTHLPEKVDFVFSIYGIGWTLDPVTTFKNIYSYLKPGGRFVWTWDHAIFSDVKLENDELVVRKSYFDDSIREKTWAGTLTFQANRRTSTWFQALRDAGFTINRYLEPLPLNIEEDIRSIAGTGMAEYYDKKKAEKLPSTIIFECIKPLGSQSAS